MTKPLHDMDIDEYLYDCVHINPCVIQEEYTRLPADMAYWSARYAEAVHEHLLAKADIEKTSAKIRIIRRIELETANGGRPTESMVEAAVNSDQAVEAARLRMINAEVDKTRLGGVLEAIRTKREMLISLGAHLRKEMDLEPTLRSLDYQRSTGR